MFGMVDQLRAQAMRDDSRRAESARGRVGGIVSTGAAYEQARRYQAHPERIALMRAALVCPPVYVAAGMWRDLMRIPTARVEPASVDGAEPTPNAVVYANHVARCIGLANNPLGVRWSTLWGEMLGAVEYGFGLWETVAENVGGVWYTRLLYRDPASIAWWLVGQDEEFAGCVQQPRYGFSGGIEIPASQLFRLTWRSVSRSDMSGVGFLRPAATLAEDHKVASQLRMVGVQRFAVGTPVATVDPEEARRAGPNAAADATDVQTMVEEYATADRAGLTMPPGWKLDIFGADYDVSRLNAVIGDISRSIYELVSMQHMLLGSADGSGSYAVGEVQRDASRQSAQAVCDVLGDEITAGLIPRIVRWQFGDVDPAELPRLRFDGLASEAFVQHLDKLAALHQAGVLALGPEARAAIHAALELPPPEAARPVQGIGLRAAAPPMPNP